MENQKCYAEMTEQELREVIEEKKVRVAKKSALYDRFGTIALQGQLSNAEYELGRVLNIAFQNGFELTEEEKDVVGLTVRRI